MFRFRWVQCQLDYIQNLRCDFDRIEAIMNLPPGLPETYRRIMERIGGCKADLKFARRALMWLAFCKRPLTLRALVIAIAIDPSKDEFDSSKVLDPHEEILDICGPLIRLETRTNIVELSHSSVREYITSKHLPHGIDNPDYIDEKEANAEILKCCLVYLSYLHLGDGPSEAMSEIFSENELLDYAVQWHLHATELETDPVTRDLISNFLNGPPSQNSFNVWSVLWLYESRYASFPRLQTSSGLYYAALFGFYPVVESVLAKKGTSEDWKEAFGGALLAAGENGDPRMVRLLLDASVDVMSEDTDGNTALHHAATRGHAAVVELLLNSKVEASARDKNGTTALHCAARNNHVEIVKMLLAAGADVNAKDEDNRTALHRAAWSGRATTVQLLLEAKADPTVKDRFGRTAIHGAAQSKHCEIVKMLMYATTLSDETDGVYDEAGDSITEIATQIRHLTDNWDALTLDEAEVAETDVQPAPDEQSRSVISTHMVCFSTFNTKDVRPETEVRLEDCQDIKDISFITPYDAVPVAFIGLNQLNIDGITGVRLEVSIPYLAPEGLCLLFECGANTMLYSAGCTWLVVGNNDPAYQCGQFSTQKDHPRNKPQQLTSSRIVFPRRYTVAPKVVVWLSKFDMNTKEHWRVRAYATDITKSGFELHIDTWDNTELYSGTAFWFAYPTGKVGIMSGSYSTREASPAPEVDTKGERTFVREVKFGKQQFTTVPRVLLAVNSFDIPCQSFLRFNASVKSVTKSGMTLEISMLTGRRTSAAAEITYLLLS